jgi:hypothetical protein
VAGHEAEGSPLMLAVIEVLNDISNVRTVSGRMVNRKYNTDTNLYTDVPEQKVRSHGQAVHACGLRTLSK